MVTNRALVATVQRPMMRYFVASLSLIALSLASSVASAELWAGRLGPLLRDAVRVEVVEVEQVAASAWQTRVVESIRGRPVGTRDTVSWFGGDVGVRRGERVLVVCERHQCPRAVGVLRGGLYTLYATESHDGAWLFPSIADPASIAPMAQGRAAPSLCVRASVRLPSTPTPSLIDLSLRAEDGEGTARTPLVPGSFSVSQRGGEFLFQGASLLLSLQSAGGARLTLLGNARGRDASGCVLADTVTWGPFARDVAELTRALSRPPQSTALARATVTITVPGTVAPGRYEASLEADASGALRLTGIPGFASEPGAYASNLTGIDVGYARRGESNASLYLRIPRPATALTRTATESLATLVQSATPTLVVLARTSGPTPTPVGTALLRRAP